MDDTSSRKWKGGCMITARSMEQNCDRRFMRLVWCLGHWDGVEFTFSKAEV